MSLRALQGVDAVGGLGLGDVDCCPKPCPGFSTRVCCTRCPATCDTAPQQMNPIQISSSERNYMKAQMNWDAPVSCAPIDNTEVHCEGQDGDYHALPVIPGAFAAWTLDMNYFLKAPFNLEVNDPLICKIKSNNRNGWSAWSAPSSNFSIPDGTKVGDNWTSPGVDQSCQCKRSCQSTGCGGCCNHQDGTFWSKAKTRACCASGTCTQGCTVKNLPDTMHRHRYCHVHAEDKNKTRKRTKWEMKTVRREQQVLRPFKTTVKRLVLQKQTKPQQQIKYELKTVKEFKTVMRKEKQTQIKIIMRKEKQNRPRMSVIKQKRTVKKHVYRPKTEQKKVIKMVKVKKMVNKVKFVNKEIRRRAVRMVKQFNTIQKQVPKNIPVPLAALYPSQVDESCGCFREDCGCYGQPGCPCCYPTCGCAPSMLSPTEVELVSRVDETMVPEDYIETVTIEVPTMVQVEVEVEEPQAVFETVTHQVPEIVDVEEEYEVPTIVDEMVEVEVPFEIEEEVMVDVPVEIEVLKERKVPVSEFVPVEIDVPVEVDQEVTEQRATMEFVNIEVPVAIEYEERIAAPPCHWHDIKHSHDIKVGLTHTHHHKD